MQPNDFVKVPSPIDDSESDMVIIPTKAELDRELIEKLRRGPLSECDDVQVAVALTRLVYDEYVGYGTGGPQYFDNDQSALALRGLKSILKRLGIEGEFPFRDFNSFHAYWSGEGMSGAGGWAARRGVLGGLFEPIHVRLEELEDDQYAKDLADPVSGGVKTGWSMVDAELLELRRRYHSASTPQDYKDVGNRCVGVLEALSSTVYDPKIHLHEGEIIPEVSKTKQRIGRYIEAKLAGGNNEALRGLVGKASEVAHSVKHNSVSGARSASIAADTVVLLASLLRRLED